MDEQDAANKMGQDGNLAVNVTHDGWWQNTLSHTPPSSVVMQPLESSSSTGYAVMGQSFNAQGSDAAGTAGFASSHMSRSFASMSNDRTGAARSYGPTSTPSGHAASAAQWRAASQGPQILSQYDRSGILPYHPREDHPTQTFPAALLNGVSFSSTLAQRVDHDNISNWNASANAQSRGAAPRVACDAAGLPSDWSPPPPWPNAWRLVPQEKSSRDALAPPPPHQFLHHHRLSAPQATPAAPPIAIPSSSQQPVNSSYYFKAPAGVKRNSIDRADWLDSGIRTSGTVSPFVAGLSISASHHYLQHSSASGGTSPHLINPHPIQSHSAIGNALQGSFPYLPASSAPQVSNVRPRPHLKSPTPRQLINASSLRHETIEMEIDQSQAMVNASPPRDPSQSINSVNGDDSAPQVGAPMHGRPKAPNRSPPPVNAQGKFICLYNPPECDGLVFDRKCEYHKHMDKHTRPWKCEDPACTKLQGFTYSGGLLRHQREVHNVAGPNVAAGGEGPREQYSCPEPGCKRHTNKGFTRKENLNEHIRRVHSGRINGVIWDDGTAAPSTSARAAKRPADTSVDSNDQVDRLLNHSNGVFDALTNAAVAIAANDSQHVMGPAAKRRRYDGHAANDSNGNGHYEHEHDANLDPNVTGIPAPVQPTVPDHPPAIGDLHQEIAQLRQELAFKDGQLRDALHRLDEFERRFNEMDANAGDLAVKQSLSMGDRHHGQNGHIDGPDEAATRLHEQQREQASRALMGEQDTQ